LRQAYDYWQDQPGNYLREDSLLTQRQSDRPTRQPTAMTAGGEPSSLLHFCVFHDFTFVRRSTADLQGVEARSICDAALSTIPVLLTLLIFSAAQKSSRSISSLKIMIHLAPRSLSQSLQHSFHTSLRLFSKRLVWPAAISPQSLTPYTTEVARVRSTYQLAYTNTA
jgi:hypothetical protein